MICYKQRIHMGLGILALGVMSSLMLTCGEHAVEPALPPPGSSVDARFGANVTAGAPPLTVSFSDQSTGQPDFWLWRFGDGQTSFNQNPTHTYTQQGVYSVTLVVTNGDAKDSLVRNDWIVVNDSIGATGPVANFVADPDSGTVPLLVQFTSTSTGTITGYSWNFGDGGTSTQASPNHIYSAVGAYTVRLIVSGPAGKDTLEKADFIKAVEPPPTAAFSAQPTSGQPPLNVQFTSQSTGQITSYLWTFGDGGSSTVENPTHSFTTQGTYTVRLIVTGPGGSDTAEIANYIAVSEGAPVVSFTGTPTAGAAPLTVQFTENTAGNVGSFLWSFGDGASSIEANPSHTYQNPGSYTVRLIGSGPGGTDTLIRVDYINVTPAAPHASFTGAPTSGTVPLTVQFSNTSTGVITTYAWTFGDGGVSNATQPTHTYYNPGKYDVRLIVTGPGGSDTLRRVQYITVNETAPVAGFTASPTSGPAPLSVQFTNTSSGSITSYAWRFGDGATSTAVSPTHTYSVTGTYDVRLIVSGPGGVDTLLRTNYISVTAGAPHADFTGTPTSGPAPLAVDFANISTGQVTSRSWNFGDGSTSTDPNPTHTYTTPGTYTVSLTITGPGGTDTMTKTDYITVGAAKPVAAFTGSPTTGPAPLSVQFTNQSTGDITSYSWRFGDGSSTTTENPTHTYETPGVYDVWLIVSGPGGVDTLTRSNYITATEPPPTASFSGSPTSGNAPLDVQFLNTSSGSITAYEWSFGDGGTSTQQSPSHTYNSPGTYTVRLIVSGPGGADTLTRADYITVTSEQVSASFTATPTSGVAPLYVQFDNTSTGTLLVFVWDFGDGQFSTQTNPAHVYENPGTYTVRLVATGVFGVDTLTRQDYITVTAPAPVADFSASTTSGTAPLTVQFTDLSGGTVSSWSWDFGDGSTSTEANPQHTYQTEGTYTVQLTVTGPGGTDTKTIINYITVTAVGTLNCVDSTLVLGQLGPLWPEHVSGDCDLGGDVKTSVSTTLFTKNGGTQLWATVNMSVEESKGDHSKGTLSQDIYLGYTAPSGWTINQIQTPANANWSYTDKDDNLDTKDFTLATFEVMAATAGPDLCGTTADDSNVTVLFHPVSVQLCQTSGAPGL